MSDNIPVAKQRPCTDLCCEDEKYVLDIYSYVQPERRRPNESWKQVFLFVTRAEQNNRSAFLQEEKEKLGLVKVLADKFCWKRTEEDSNLIAKLQIGDFDAVRMIERQKIDQMRWPEKVTYTLPSCDASAMKIEAKLLSGSLAGEILLETEELNVKLAPIPPCETKPATEHEHVANHPREQGLIPE